MEFINFMNSDPIKQVTDFNNFMKWKKDHPEQWEEYKENAKLFIEEMMIFSRELN